MTEQSDLAGPNPFLQISYSSEELDSMFNSPPIDIGRESLGIFDQNHPIFGRESINLVPNFIERESFGLLRESLINSSIFPFDLLKSPTSLAKIEDEDMLTDTLNNITVISKTDDVPNLLLPKTNRLTNKRFRNSQTSTPIFRSYNSGTLEGIGSSSSGFIDSIDEKEIPIFVRSSISSPLKHNVTVLEKDIDNKNNSPPNLDTQDYDLLDLWNSFVLQESIPKDATYIHTVNSGTTKDVLNENLTDPVFRETQLLASKTADGRLLGTESDSCNLIDSISMPDELLDPEMENSGPDNHSNVSPNNIIDSHESVKSKSNEAINCINSVAEYLRSSGLPTEQQIASRNLLASLADLILSNTNREGLEDSGHPSIESESAPLDLKKRTSSANNINLIESEECVPLDLSFKSKSFASPKILPPKFNRTQLSQNRTSSFGSLYSLSSNDSKNSTDSSKKFKQKSKVSENGGAVKKGPMKAILPLDNMARNQNRRVVAKTTPINSESKQMNKLKKSTPINDPHLKPVAQSTPGNSQVDPRASPVARPTKTMDFNPKILKYNVSCDRRSLNVKDKSNLLQRRLSSVELKTTPTNRRFSSVGENSSVKMSANNARQNVLKRKESTSVLKENNTKPVVSRYSFNRTKKVGKEN